MKWLVYGLEGWIGSQLRPLLPGEVISGRSRANEYENVEKEIRNHNPDRVVSLIGRTSGSGFSTIDYLEQPGKLVDNIRDNLYGPLILGEVCRCYGIHLTYLGTGCIFTYGDQIPVAEDEDAKPNFFGSSYSIVKGFTDQWFHHQKNILNVRIRMPIVAENHPKNFITKIVNYPKILSTLNSMTVLPDLLPVMVEKMISGDVGTVNLVNPGPMTHNEILELYRDLVNPDFKWTNFSESEHDSILSAKRSKCILNSEEMANLGVPTLKESLTKMWTR